MTTTHDNIQGQDFARHCVDALSDLRRALPDTYKEALQPYKEKIDLQARQTGSTMTHAVLNLLTALNNQHLTKAALKVQHLFFMAAYCDML